MSHLCSKAAETEKPLRAGDRGRMVKWTHPPPQEEGDGKSTILEEPFHTFHVLMTLGLKHTVTSERFPLSTPRSPYTSRLYNLLAWHGQPGEIHIYTHTTTTWSGHICNPHASQPIHPFTKPFNTTKLKFLLKIQYSHSHGRAFFVHMGPPVSYWTNQIPPSETKFKPIQFSGTFQNPLSKTYRQFSYLIPNGLFSVFQHYKLNPIYWYIPELVTSKRRLDYAYVHFLTKSDLDKARRTTLQVNGHTPIWLTPETRVCSRCHTLTYDYRICDCECNYLSCASPTLYSLHQMSPFLESLCLCQPECI